MASIINDVALNDLKQANSKGNSVVASADSLSWSILRGLGSLKITVTMFAFAILILFVGTLAQDEQSLVDVKKIYFNSWIALVPHHVFAPITIFGQHSGNEVLIPMPGGALIGLVLLINLIAAKFTRFSMQARGTTFVVGTALVLFGLGVTTFVILNAHASNGLQGEPSVPYDVIWYGTVASVYASVAALVGYYAYRRPKTRLMRGLLWITVASLIGLGVFFAFYRIPEPGLRIVWQLFKSLIAGVIMLVGLTMLFGKRGGNVLIHLAVGLLMLSQFVFGDRQHEELMILQTGETSNLAISQDEVELAFVESDQAGTEKHVALDQDLLIQYSGKGYALTDDRLPFDIRIDKFMKNSKLIRADGSRENYATEGAGKMIIATELPAVGGASRDSNKASAYISLLDKESRKVIGTWLVAQDLNDAAQLYMKTEEDQLEAVDHKGKTYQLGIRYRRDYKSFDVTMLNGARINYAGTDTARDFFSEVKVINRESDLSQIGKIWMNNPLRFDGKTFIRASLSAAIKYLRA